MTFLEETRDSYDTIAEDYVVMARDDWRSKPLDRAMVETFAEVAGRAGGPVGDIGCGPGRLSVVLRDRGLDVIGIDLSPRMIELARAAYPGIRFEVGSMLELALPDGELGGLLAYYSIIHVPWELRARVFAEFHRVLKPGGELMLAFQVGDHGRTRTEAFGKVISATWWRQRPDEIVALLGAAGFDVWSRTERIAQDEESVPQAFVLARKRA